MALGERPRGFARLIDHEEALRRFRCHDRSHTVKDEKSPKILKEPGVR